MIFQPGLGFVHPLGKCICDNFTHLKLFLVFKFDVFSRFEFLLRFLRDLFVLRRLFDDVARRLRLFPFERLLFPRDGSDFL